MVFSGSLNSFSLLSLNNKVKFIVMSGYIDLMVDRLNEGFGFDVETKRTIARIKDLEKWYSYFDENSQGMNHKPLLDKQIYLLF